MTYITNWFQHNLSNNHCTLMHHITVTKPTSMRKYNVSYVRIVSAAGHTLSHYKTTLYSMYQYHQVVFAARQQYADTRYYPTIWLEDLSMHCWPAVMIIPAYMNMKHHVSLLLVSPIGIDTVGMSIMVTNCMLLCKVNILYRCIIVWKTPSDSGATSAYLPWS